MYFNIYTQYSNCSCQRVAWKDGAIWPPISSFDETWGLTAPSVSCTVTVKSLQSVRHPSPQES